MVTVVTGAVCPLGGSLGDRELQEQQQRAGRPAGCRTPDAYPLEDKHVPVFSAGRVRGSVQPHMYLPLTQQLSRKLCGSAPSSAGQIHDMNALLHLQTPFSRPPHRSTTRTPWSWPSGST